MKVDSFFSHGFYISSLAPDQELFHQLCGKHHIEGAHCPNCRKPLLQIFSLNLLDPVIKTPCNLKTSTIPFLFCWTCELAEHEFSYQLSSDSHGDRIRILIYKQGSPFKDFPYEGYPKFFPECKVELIPVTVNDQDLFSSLNETKEENAELEDLFLEYAKPNHMIGGEPYLVDPAKQTRCINCSSRMYHLAAFGDSTGATKGFVENEFVQLVYHFCPGCLVLTAFQRCD